MSFNEVIDDAFRALPDSVRRAPWIGLEHGVVPLDSEQKLDQYLAAYGKMHVEKVRMALDSLDNLDSLLCAPVSIVDWGCGQGLATCCFFDWLCKNEIELSRVSRIHLIEPSGLALQRAQNNITKYSDEFNCQFDIRPVNRYINDIQSADFDIREINTTLHLFSNILDIEDINLDFLSQFMQRNFTGRQVFCCVGPLNNGASRIMDFARKFGVTTEQIEANVKGKLAYSRGTISMLTFVIDDGRSTVRKAVMEPTAPQNIRDNITLQRLLTRYTPSQDILDRILQFYLMSTELEQLKEPEIDIKKSTPFVMTETAVGLRVSFEENSHGDPLFTAACKNYAAACKRNANPQQTKWPKDLHFALEVEWDGHVHRLLYATKPLSELGRFDYDHDAIILPLNDFSVNLSCAESLELTDEKIDEIEIALHSNGISLASLAKQITAVIDSTAHLNTTQIYLSLCEKQKALEQTHAELKKIDARSIRRNPLLEAFLENAEFENTIEDIATNELISAVPMDEYQRKAIAHALGSRVSVVVGPPGCGKTQLLLNLLANALIRGKNVLVASKNNKAVDNVADRFSEFDDNGSFLRFGAKQYLRDTTCPKIAELLNLSQDQSYDDTSYQSAVKTYHEAIEGFIRKKKLTTELSDCKDACSTTQSRIEKLRGSFGVAQDLDIENIKGIKDQLRKIIAGIDYRISGLSGLWTRIFHTKSIVKQTLDAISSFPAAIFEYLQTVDGRNRVSLFANCSELIVFCQKYYDALDIILNDIIAYRENQEKLKRISIELEHIEKTNGQVFSCEFGQRLVALALNHYLHANDSSRAISAYKHYLPENIPWKDAEIPVFITETKRFLNVCRLVAVTSLSVKNAFPRAEGLFDLLVIDEASQCDVASALPLILRAKQVVIIGDPMQLRHISKIDVEEELVIKRHLNLSGATHLKYAETSLWDYARNWLPWCDNDAPCVLENHYRCHPDIIGYSNDMFYRTLAIGGLNVLTPRFNDKPQGIVWVDVQGQQTSDTKNSNEAEARRAVAIAKKIALIWKDVTIGIVTPFKDQAEKINDLIPANLRDHDKTIVDTVHKFQGDEKDVMIYSLVVTKNSPDSKIRWIDYKVPNLVNVAVTRARRLLVIVGNRNYIREHSRRDLPLGGLEAYVSMIEARARSVQNTDSSPERILR